MNLKYFIFSVIILNLMSCKDIPGKEDFLGVYNVIKVDEGGQIIQISPLLNHIELTGTHFIYRNDRDGNNRFTANEITKSVYTFAIDDEGTPFIWTSGNEANIYLLEDKYYDLIFKRVDNSGTETLLYTKKAR